MAKRKKPKINIWTIILAIIVVIGGLVYSGIQVPEILDQLKNEVGEYISDAAKSSSPSQTVSTSKQKTADTELKDTQPVQTKKPSEPVSGEMMTVDVLDVGQGDSIFITLPGGKTVLIDASESKYSDKIIEYVKNIGCDRIDYLVATHPHSDHIGGMRKVVKAFEIGEVYMPKVSNNTSTYEKFLEAVRDKGCKIHSAESGQSIEPEDGSKIEILAPVGDQHKDLNNWSIVMRLVYGDTAFLFTGDAEEDSESQITGDVSADVLKVGHHGSSSSTSDAFLERVSPEYAVISCGVGNDYGHPHRETIDKLNKAGIPILRTDELGDICFASDGTQVIYMSKSE